MLFPELHKSQINCMKPSKELLFGLFHRLGGKPRQKVFVIGFHKTGTSSLGKALQLLGYKVCGSLKEGFGVSTKSKTYKEDLMTIAGNVKLFDTYNAFQDTPWFLLYEELYVKFPEAKFILTIREEQSWLQSVQKHFASGNFAYHSFIYNSLDSLMEAEHYVETYKNHNDNVISFFKKEQADLLVLDIKASNKWKLLSDFLQLEAPKTEFPHANKAKDRYSFAAKIKRGIKKIYYD